MRAAVFQSEKIYIKIVSSFLLNQLINYQLRLFIYLFIYLYREIHLKTGLLFIYSHLFIYWLMHKILSISTGNFFTKASPRKQKSRPKFTDRKSFLESPISSRETRRHRQSSKNPLWGPVLSITFTVDSIDIRRTCVFLSDS